MALHQKVQKLYHVIIHQLPGSSHEDLCKMWKIVTLLGERWLRFSIRRCNIHQPLGVLRLICSNSEALAKKLFQNCDQKPGPSKGIFSD